MTKHLRYITRVGVVVVLTILAAITWAGVLQDGGGNEISTDIVAPAGGARIASGGGAVLNSCIGQTAVGLSFTTADARLCSGVLTPRRLPEPAVWIVH